MSESQTKSLAATPRESSLAVMRAMRSQAAQVWCDDYAHDSWCPTSVNGACSTLPAVLLSLLRCHNQLCRTNPSSLILVPYYPAFFVFSLAGGESIPIGR